MNVIPALLVQLAVATGTPPVSPAVKVDHFGYRPTAAKIAIFNADPGASVEIRSAAGVTVLTVPGGGGSIAYRGEDGPPSGDEVWWVDFSPLAAPGEYYVYSPRLGGRSYLFRIADDVYWEPLRAAFGAFYLQRCNTPKEAVWAGAWADPDSCHDSDVSVGPAPGHQDHGLLDLRGGWHDAGDYNKYVWSATSTAVLGLLRAWEDRPELFADGTMPVPEAGNGVPDLLDEVRWELDWMLAMQLPDGSVLSQMHVDGFASASPPSADTNVRLYHDPTLESGSVFTGTCALASRVYAAAGLASYAATLKSAALDAWTWLQGQGDSEEKVWAAAELFRMDPALTAARDYVDGFYPSQWSGRFFNPARYDTHAAITYIVSSGASPAVVANMRASVGAQVDYIFDNDDLYRNGMPDWSYYWGSNSIRAWYGLFLLDAATLGETGGHAGAETLAHAEDFLHFFHGQNTLSMLYLTNMAARGGEHSSFQLYHAWFGDSNSSSSSALYIGKPPGIVEPAYPYFDGVDNHGISDDKVSTLGPAPGLVPGGPNKDYGGDASPPLGSTYYNRFYRDWNDQTVWTARTWEITENSIGYQGPYVALAAHFAALPDVDLFSDGFESGTTSAWSQVVP